MIDVVKDILNNKAEEVIKSPQLSLSLLKCYSLLYMNGKAPRVCERSQRQYYSQLKKDGIMKADLYEKAKNRTCKPNWNGLKFVQKESRHINSDLINDDEAVLLIKRGSLKASDFKVLPKEMRPKAPQETKKAKKNTKK